VVFLIKYILLKSGSLFLFYKYNNSILNIESNATNNISSAAKNENSANNNTKNN